MPADGLIPEIRDATLFDRLTRLLWHRTLDPMLEEALSMLVDRFQAVGGMIYLASLTNREVVRGTVTDMMRQHIRRQYMADSADPTARGEDHPEGPAAGESLDDGCILYLASLFGLNHRTGLIGLSMPSGCTLDATQVQDLHALARGIGAIAANVEQSSTTRQRLSQLGLFYQIGQAMTSTFDLERLFQRTIDLAIAVLDAQEAQLFLVDEDGWTLKPVGMRGGAPPVPPPPHLGQGIAGWVAECGIPVLSNDVAADTRFDPRVDGFPGQPTRSLVCVPMQIKGQMLGALEILNKWPPHLFDEQDLNLLRTLAAQVSIALENARLYNSLRAERDRILEAQETTRHTLARNLHDGPVQLLAAIAMELDYLERIMRERPDAVGDEMAALRKMVKQATQDARILLFELRPLILETQGLVPALESYVERLNTSGRFEVHLDHGGFEQDLEIHVAGAIFAIIQEAINNIEKHAAASQVWINLAQKEDELVITIQDNGKGFDVSSTMAHYYQGSSLGLINMQERAELLNGKLTLESGTTPGESGTLVQLSIQLPGVQVDG